MKDQSVRDLEWDIESLLAQADANSAELLDSHDLWVLWVGEAHFVLALSYSVRNQFAGEKRHFLLASEYFDRAGAHHKSLKALQNVLAAEGDMNPERSQIPEFLGLANRALERSCGSIAGLAYGNVSRFYQKLGAFRWALHYANLCVQNLEDERGSLQYYLAIAHRAHLCIELEKFEAATMDHELLLESNHLEIQEVRAALSAKLKSIGEISKPHAIIHFWDDRDLKETTKELSVLQQKLLARLLEKPATRHELIEHIYEAEYGKIDSEVLENRFKNLLANLRKRCPDLVAVQDGYYMIVRVS